MSSSSLSYDSSCSSSDSDSSSCSDYGSTLGASQWNRQKDERPVRPRTVEGSLTQANDEQMHHADRHLVERRYYPSTDITDITSPDGGDGANTVPADVVNDATSKSELEMAVVMDCLSNHFLWSHLSKEELQRLCNEFKRCRYRDHEIIYSQGDDAQYLYILFSGEISRRRMDTSTAADGSIKVEPIDNKSEEKYTVLGELAVLTGSSHQETAQATSNCTFFRLGRAAFHRALRPIPVIDSEERTALLKQAIPEEMNDHFTYADFRQLASTMTMHSFQSGDVLVSKKDQLDSLVVIAKGLVTAKDVSMGGKSYDDESYGTDASKISFGWQIILTERKHPHFMGTVVAESDGIALMLSRSAFHAALGSHAKTTENLAAHRLARIQLQQMPIFQDSLLDETQINALLDLMHRCEYEPENGNEKATIFKAGEKVEAALYFVRQGAITLLLNKGEDEKTIEEGDYFGEANMLRDQNKDGRKHFIIRSPMTAMAHGPRTIIDVLYLEEIRTVVDTTLLGLGAAATFSAIGDSIQLADINRHSLLGTGSFGQVWLASIPTTRSNESDGEVAEEKKSNKDEPGRQIVALKVQSKYQAVVSEKAERVVAERNILASLKSPFLLRLFNAFQDDSRLYMITSVCQGGELESLIPSDGLSEQAAKFYAAGILEGLAYMHRRHLIHRDIKPSNVLIDSRGYPVLIDFGFAKYVPDKTYTFVGSPLFTAPEIIRAQGYDRGSDNWAWAVLTYKLVTGRYPFYEKDIDELQLYKRICKGTFELDGLMSVEFRILMVSLLYPKPSQRLGFARHGWRDIFASPWFANDDSMDLLRLRRQDLPAPWAPGLKDPLDASSFHPRDESEMEDLMYQIYPEVEEKDQNIFASFGPQINE